MKGGKREGAGRPAIIEGQRLQRVTVTLPPEYVAWAKLEGSGNVSDGLRRLLEELDQRQGADQAGRLATLNRIAQVDEPGTGTGGPLGR